MGRGIRLSKNHGVNACIPVCVFCGEPKNEIAMLGQLPGDEKAPKHAILDVIPCDECLKNWEQGVALIRVSKTPEPEGMPSLTVDGHEVYPTGKYLVMTEDGASRLLERKTEKGKPVLIEAAAYDRIVEDMRKAGLLDEEDSLPKGDES